MRNVKKTLFLLMAALLAFGMFPLPTYAATRSLDEREIEDYLKPGDSPMDAVPDVITLTQGSGDVVPVATDVSLDGTWDMAAGGSVASRLMGFTVACDSALSSADNLFDGKWSKDSEAWISDDSTGAHWASIDMAESVTANKFVIKHFAGDFVTKDFEIQGSADGETWNTIRSIKDNTEEETVVTLDTPVEYRYFRLYVTDPNDAMVTPEIGDIESFTINHALNKPVTTNSDTLASSDMGISNLTDGSWANQVGDCWVTNKAGYDSVWAVIDLQTTQTFDEIKVYNVGADGTAGSTADLNTSDYTLLGSDDDSIWTEIGSIQNNQEAVNSFQLTEPVSYRYVKVDITKPHTDGSAAGNNYVRMYEIEVLEHETDTYINIAKDKAVTANSDYLAGSEMGAVNLTDGAWVNQSGDAWVTDYSHIDDGSPNVTATIDLEKTQYVDRIRIHHIGVTGLNTKAFTVSGSVNGTDWTQIHEETNNLASLTDIKLSTPGEYRYIRISVSEPHQPGNAEGNNHLRIYEVEVLEDAARAAQPVPDNKARIYEFQVIRVDSSFTNVAKGCSVEANSNSLPADYDASFLTNGIWSGQVGNCWVTNFAVKTGPSAYAIVDLGKEKSIDKIKIYHIGADGAASSTPDLNTSDYTVQTSVDRTTWTTVGSEVGNTDNICEYEVTSAPIRYIKMDITKPHADGSLNGANHVRVYEIEALSEQTRETLLSEFTESTEWTDAIPATVPGSVHTALMDNGLLEDPYDSLNDEAAREASFKDYWFKKTFNLSESDLAGDVRLSFEGICESATIYLNGQKLGSHVGMFGGPDFDISDAAKLGENVLVIHLNGAPNRARKPGEMPTFFGGGNEWLNLGWIDTVIFNNSYGWHYSYIPPLGIWQSVKLTKVPNVEIVNPFIAAKNTNGTMDFSVDLTAEAGFSGTLVGKISPKNFDGESYTFAYPVTSTEDTKNVRLQFDIPDAQLWWPNGLGDQNLYNLELVFKSGETAVDYEKTSFGIRTIEMAPAGPQGAAENQDLYNWKFIINGKESFLKGTGWCTTDSLMRFTKENYDKYLSMAKLQNIQMLRAWGSGMVETDEFYDLCDEYGITVMQEWPTAWDSYVYQPEDALLETVERNVLRLRNRPSLFLWCGGNEGGAPLEGTGAYDPTVLNKMGKLTLELDGTRPWHRQDPYGGSRHDYSASWGGQNPSVNMSLEATFWGEFGVDCFPNYESILKYTPKEELDALEALEGTDEWAIKANGVISYHTPMFNKAGDLGRQLQHVKLFLPLNSMKNAVMGSQIAQAVGVRYTLERARTRFPYSTGALMYKLNDNYPAASWSTVDWYGSPKYAFYVVQDSFEPLTAIARLDAVNYNSKPLDIPIYLVDDADELKNSSWKVNTKVYNANGEVVKDVDMTGSGSISNVQKLGTVSLTAEQTDSAPLYIVTSVSKGEELVARNFYYINYEAKQGCLFDMPKTTLEYEVNNNVYTITNTGEYPAINVSFECADVSDTFRPEDNFIWLEPGETRKIAVNSSTGVTGITSWNYAVQDSTPPTAPQNLQATALDDRTVSLTWDASEDADSGIMNYEIYRNGVKVGRAGSTETTYTDTNLSESTQYTYKVYAVNNGLTVSAASNEDVVTTPADTTKPEVLSVDVNGTTSLTVTFNEKVDTATAENLASYTISPELLVKSATLNADKTQVTLEIDEMDTNATYQLSITGVKDASVAKNVMVNYQANIAFGLLGYWKLDENTGTAFKDDAGRHEDGKLTNVQWATGKSGSALSFTGDGSQSAIINTSEANVGNSFTIASWMKAESARENMHVLIAKNSKASGHYEIYIANDGTMRFYSPDLQTSSGGVGDFGSGYVVDDNQWHHVAVTMDSGKLSFYVDGTMVKEETANGSIHDVTAPLSIGRMVVEEGGVIFPFKGLVDEVKIYSRKISQREMNTLAGIVNAPMLTPGAAVRTSDNIATVKFTSDEAGTYYYEIVEDGAAAPDIDTTGAGTVCATSQQTITLNSLTAGAKDIYIVVKNASNMVSTPIKIDIDAYIQPDGTAPTLTPGAAVRTRDSNATVKFTSDEAGQYYYAIVDDNANAPTINTSGSGANCGTSEMMITLTDLTAGAKDIYIAVKDAAGNVSTPIKIDIDAYVADTVPTLMAGTISRTSDSDATVKFTSSKAGSYYYAIVDQGAAAPSIDTTGAGTACDTNEQTITLNTLTAGAKDIYIVAKGTAGVSEAIKIEIPAYTAGGVTNYNITATAGVGGSISPSGAVSVSAGSSKMFTITPDSGYSIVSVKVDGVDKGAISTYTFSDIEKSHTIVASFAKTTYYLTITAGAGGSITVGGSGSYEPGAVIRIAATPKDGYKFEKWTTSDGGTFADASVASTTFTMPAKATAINASFVAKGYVDEKDIVEKEDQVMVDLTDGSDTISKEQLDALIKANKDKPVVMQGNGYTMTFPAGSMSAANFDGDMDLGVSFNSGSYYAVIKSKAGDDFVLMLDFNHSGKLPGEAQIRIFVGKKYAGETLKYYYYNTEQGKFTYMMSAKVDSDGYVVIKQDHCSSYMFTLYDADNIPLTGDTSSNWIWWTLLGIAGAGLLALVWFKLLKDKVLQHR